MTPASTRPVFRACFISSTTATIATSPIGRWCAFAMSTPGGPTESTGLVVALPAEAHSLGMHGMHPGDCERWRDGWIAVSGIGPHNAMGVAGALDATLAAGDLLIVDRIRYARDDPGFATDVDANERLAATFASALHVRRG